MASCNTGKIKTKKKIIIFSSIGLGIAAATYLAFTTTNNPAVAAAIPALLSISVCPAMCAAVGGGIWLKNRFSKNKNKNNNVTSIGTAKKEESCCDVPSTNKKQQKTKDIEILEGKDENDISISQQKQKIKYKN
jgi:hypothetical protein